MRERETDLTKIQQANRLLKGSDIQHSGLITTAEYLAGMVAIGIPAVIVTSVCIKLMMDPVSRTAIVSSIQTTVSDFYASHKHTIDLWGPPLARGFYRGVCASVVSAGVAVYLRGASRKRAAK